MAKYINAKELIEMFEDDEMLSCDRPFDVYQWARNIIEECPAAKNVIECPANGIIIVTSSSNGTKELRLPLSINQKVWTPDGIAGRVDSFYFGRSGIQRIFVTLESGERINFTAKGIGKDILTSDPAERATTPSDGF